MREYVNRHRATIFSLAGLVIPLFLLYVHGRSPRQTTVIEAALINVTPRAVGRESNVWRRRGRLVGLYGPG